MLWEFKVARADCCSRDHFPPSQSQAGRKPTQSNEPVSMFLHVPPIMHPAWSPGHLGTPSVQQAGNSSHASSSSFRAMAASVCVKIPHVLFERDTWRHMEILIVVQLGALREYCCASIHQRFDILVWELSCLVYAYCGSCQLEPRATLHINDLGKASVQNTIQQSSESDIGS